MAKVVLKNFNLSGIADSDYLGVEGSVAELACFDIHSKPGVLRVNQRLMKESGLVIDQPCYAYVNCSDGNTYFFGHTNGKIFKRTGGGTYSEEATNAEGAIYDAMEHQGYIYYASLNKLGRWEIGTAWSSRDDDWATFTNGHIFHPMRVISQILFIGDKSLVAQVDGGTFTANALDLESTKWISVFGRMGTDLIIGAYSSNASAQQSELIRWDTYSPSFSSVETIPEHVINTIIEGDNFVLINAGQNGKMYSYNGSSLQEEEQIPFRENGHATTQINYSFRNAYMNWHGMLIFGISGIDSARSAKQGLYSYARSGKNYPYVLNLENIISTGNTANVSITCLVNMGDYYLVGWQDGVNFGVDKLDLTLKAISASIETRFVSTEREKLVNFKELYIPYARLPENTEAVLVYAYRNNESAQEIPMVNDAQRALFASSGDIGEAAKVRIKIFPTVYQNTAPEFEQIIIKIGEE